MSRIQFCCEKFIKVPISVLFRLNLQFMAMLNC